MSERPTMDELRDEARERSGRESPECRECGRGPREARLELYGIACPGARRIYLCHECIEEAEADD